MATDLTQYADRTGRMTVDTLSFAVRVIEARNRYGHLDFRVTPIAGGRRTMGRTAPDRPRLGTTY